MIYFFPDTLKMTDLLLENYIQGGKISFSELRHALAHIEGNELYFDLFRSIAFDKNDTLMLLVLCELKPKTEQSAFFHEFINEKITNKFIGNPTLMSIISNI